MEIEFDNETYAGNIEDQIIIVDTCAFEDHDDDKDDDDLMYLIIEEWDERLVFQLLLFHTSTTEKRHLCRVVCCGCGTRVSFCRPTLSSNS